MELFDNLLKENGNVKKLKNRESARKFRNKRK